MRYKWTTAQRPTNPPVGTSGFNTTLGYPEVWNGAAWLAMSGGSSEPAGVVKLWCGTMAACPAGWAIANGALLPVAAHPNLFAAIGYTWGGGGPSFALPNLQGRFPRGAVIDAERAVLGGSSTPTITASPNITGATVGAAPTGITVAVVNNVARANGGVATAGAQAAAVTDPTHNHGLVDPGHTHAVATADGRPPFDSFHYIIKTG